MKTENNFRHTINAHPSDAPDESLRKINSLLGGVDYVDHSGTITDGGTSQEVAAANEERIYLFFLNVSDTEMWLGIGAAGVASQPSIKIPAGGYYEPIRAPRAALHVMCATTGKEFVCKEA